jgi:hypothetical protein
VTGGPPNFGGIPQRAAGRSKMSVCSTTRVKSATVFSWMIDGSGSLACRIFGGAVAELVGIEGGVVSGVINLESSGVEASD